MTVVIYLLGTALTCGAAGFVGYKLGQRAVTRNLLLGIVFGRKP